MGLEDFSFLFLYFFRRNKKKRPRVRLRLSLVHPQGQALGVVGVDVLDGHVDVGVVVHPKLIFHPAKPCFVCFFAAQERKRFVLYLFPILHGFKNTYWMSDFKFLFTVGFWCQGIAQKIFRTFDTSFDTKMMVKSGAIEIIFKSHEPFQSYLLTGQADSFKKAGW